MAVNLESLKAAMPPASSRLDRRDAEARQDRWMSELEKAIVSSISKQQPAPAPAPRAHAEPGSRSALGKVAATASTHPALTAQQRSQAQAAASHRASDEEAQSARGRSQRNAPDSALAPEEDRVAADQSNDTDAVPAAVVQARATAAITQHGANVELPAALGVAVSDTAQALPGQSPVAPFAAAPNASGGDAEASASLATPGRRAVSIGITAQGQPQVRSEPQTAGVDAPEIPAGAGGHEAGEAQPFEKRAMHLYQANDGVHAWIRDADLQSHQLRAVAQAMSAELATSGKTLAALTINGKPVDARVIGARPDEDDAFAEAGESVFATPLYDLRTPVRKGNQ